MTQRGTYVTGLKCTPGRQPVCLTLLIPRLYIQFELVTATD